MSMTQAAFAVAIGLAFGSAAPPVARGDDVNQNGKVVELPRPKPEYEAKDVVKIVLDALKKNDTPRKDAGIETAFNFASPGNKAATGPLERFIRLVHNPLYEPMLGHKSSSVGLMKVDGDVARQRATLVAKDGSIVVYEFTLSKDPKSGCWVTDGVMVVPPADA